MNSAVHMKNMVLGVLAVAGSAMAQALGGWDMALKVLIGFMVLDYVTGWLVAAVWHKSSKSETGALASNAGFKGLIKKCMILALVWMAAMLDRVTGSDFVRTAVCLFFIANEGLSIIENAGKHGIKLPKALRNALVQLKMTANSETSNPQTKKEEDEDSDAKGK